ncbi:MAG: glycoside hydrolase family 25 protein [Bacteroides sp.]|nr:glycoside hydrolase family 25 protein [Bacteroides sp.]
MTTKTTNTTRRKKNSLPARSKSKAVAASGIPVWQRNLLAVGMVLVFSLGFYWFFIRPYAYRWKLCYGMKGYGVCMPCNYEVHGIDISHYQGKIDWLRVTHDKNQQFPLHFVFMKATEGGDYKDSTFTRNFGQAREAGIIRGAYHYFLPQTDANKQADFFINTVKLEPGDLPPVLDVEVTGKKSAEELKRVVRLWLDRVEAHYEVKPILYTSYKFKMRYLNDSIFNTYPYWIAHYYVDSVRYKGRWHFWQHTDVGTVPGIENKVDLNVFNGTLEELDSLRIRHTVSDINQSTK